MCVCVNEYKLKKENVEQRQNLSKREKCMNEKEGVGKSVCVIKCVGKKKNIIHIKYEREKKTKKDDKTNGLITKHISSISFHFLNNTKGKFSHC